MVHASRRDAAGQAEVHARDADIIYVLDGTARFVTGGTVVDPKTTARDEVRGQVDRRTARRGDLKKGDVDDRSRGHAALVPATSPTTFTYYVVKVR